MIHHDPPSLERFQLRPSQPSQQYGLLFWPSKYVKVRLVSQVMFCADESIILYSNTVGSPRNVQSISVPRPLGQLKKKKKRSNITNDSKTTPLTPWVFKLSWSFRNCLLFLPGFFLKFVWPDFHLWGGFYQLRLLGLLIPHFIGSWFLAIWTVVTRQSDLKLSESYHCFARPDGNGQNWPFQLKNIAFFQPPVEQLGLAVTGLPDIFFSTSHYNLSWEDQTTSKKLDLLLCNLIPRLSAQLVYRCFIYI